MKFKKYQTRSASYHWQQVSRNIFHFNAFVSARYRQVIRAVSQTKRQKILDIGCGDGLLLYFLSQKTKAQLYGLDSDQQGLNFARNNVKASFIKGTATKLPFKNGFFDVVLATEIIEHLNRPESMLQEIQRVLKQKGKLILTTPVKLGPIPEDKQHVKEFTSFELSQLLKKYFQAVNITSSHPAWLKRLYLFSLIKLGRYHLEPFRLLINLLALKLNLNLFLLSSGNNSQQMAVCNL